MLAMSVRVSPWSPRWNPSSTVRSTMIVPSSLRMATSAWNVCSSEPRGPVTATREPSTTTSTLPGISMGCLPMRLTVLPLLPDECQDLAAEAVPRRVAVGHQALRGAHDRDAEPAHHAGQPVALRVHAAAGLGHALQAGDGALAALAVLQDDMDGRLDALALPGEGLDVALLGEHAGEGLVHLRGRHVQLVLRRDVRVADPGEHVRDRVGDVRPQSHHDDFVTPGSSPACASSRKQMRHSRNLRYTARARPHLRHRV